MSAVVTITIVDPNATIGQLTSKLDNSSGADRNAAINRAADYLMQAASGGVAAGTVKIVVRDTDPSVGTSGSGSQSLSLSVG
jgi:hypothetical protein